MYMHVYISVNMQRMYVHVDEVSDICGFYCTQNLILVCVLNELAMSCYA